MPDGLTFDAATGAINGTPTGAGTWYFEAVATDADGEAVSNGFLSIQINPAAIAAANPVPFLNETLVPTSVSPGGSGFTLNVSGTGFVSGATVGFNGAPLTTTFVDREHLSALVPAASVATAQTAAVTVVNPAAGGGSSNVVYFQVGTPESEVNFANAPNSPLSVPESFGLAAADFNQDGKPDLAVAGGGGLYVELGNGDGTFTPAPNSPERMPSPPYNDFATPEIGPMAVGDFTHSGHPGLAVAEWDSAAVVILLGNGSGTFAPSSATFENATYLETSTVVAADFNADGNLDLATPSEIYWTTPIALGYGSGAFNMGGQLYTGFTGLFPTGRGRGRFQWRRKTGCSDRQHRIGEISVFWGWPYR